MPRTGVELDVARLATQSDGRDPLAPYGDHGLDTAGLVRDEHVPLDRVVGEAIRVASCRSTRQDLVRSAVDGQYFVVVRSGREDPIDLRHCNHTVNTGGIDDVDDSPGAETEC